MSGSNESNAIKLAQQVADRLAAVDGVTAIALGGSLARGMAHPDSDIDLGIYYNSEQPPSLKVLRQLAAELDDSHASELITAPGEWGLWINGGGWLKINGTPVDWLYRDITLVSKVITDCQSGKTNCHYYPGHPHGFHDHYYLADIYYCQILHDSNGVLSSFKKTVANYPALLKKTLIEKYLWEASFSIQTSVKAANREDVVYVTGCLFRCIACLIQVLFALNERYINNEKGAIKTTNSLALCPNDFKEIVTKVLGNPGTNKNQLLLSIKTLESLIEEVKKLIKGI